MNRAPFDMIETDEDRERDKTIEEMAVRMVRIETRLVTLMAHMGMKVPEQRDKPQPGREDA